MGMISQTVLLALACLVAVAAFPAKPDVETGLISIKDKSQEVANEAAKLATSLESEMKITEIKQKEAETTLEREKENLAQAKKAAQEGAQQKAQEAQKVKEDTVKKVAEVKAEKEKELVQEKQKAEAKVQELKAATEQAKVETKNAKSQQ